MTVAITCAGCRRSLRVAENLIGQSVRCPLCVEAFVAAADPNQPRTERPAPRKRGAAPAAERTVEEVAITPEEEFVEAELVSRPFKPFTFSILFEHDPDRLFRGRAEAEVSIEGLRVRLRNRRDFWVSVGGEHQARYLGGNRLAVVLDGREVVCQLVRRRTDLDHLARDVAAFLNGAPETLKARDYELPWKITLLPWLAVAVPILAIWLRVLGGVHGGGRFLWCLLGGGAVLLGFHAVRRETLATRRRVLGAMGVVGACFLLLGGALAYRWFVPTRVPSESWASFAPPGKGCGVLMPGTPRMHIEKVAGDANTAVYMVPFLSLNKTFSLGIGRIERNHFRREWDARTTLYELRSTLEQEILDFGSGNAMPVDKPVGDGCIQILLTPRYRSQTPQVTRLCLAGDQIFSLTVVGEDLDEDDPDIKKFFDSFHLTAAPMSPEAIGGLIARWAFEDFDPRVRDEQDGAIYVNVERTVGVRGRGVTLTGRSYINFDASADLDFDAGEAFSCVGWLKTTSNARLASVLSMAAANAQTGTCLDIFLVGGRLRVTMEPEVPLLKLANEEHPGVALNDGSWHHFALTRSERGMLTLYVDGRTEEIVARNRFTAGSLLSTRRSFGSRERIPWSAENLQGSLDEIAFFNRCLSADEIAQLCRAE